jgi:hypothetical protein
MYYKMINGEMICGNEIHSPAYTLTTKTKDKPVDGWVWYDKPPFAEVILPCGCHVKMLIDPAKAETMETAQAEVDVISAKVIEGKAPPKLSVSAVAVAIEPIIADEPEASIG